MSIVSSPAARAVPRVRPGLTFGFEVGSEPGTLTASVLPDGGVGEVTLRAGKHGSTLAGLTDAFSTAVTLALRQGAPLAAIADELRGTHFAPAGQTDDPEIPEASSLVDYVARRLTNDFAPIAQRHAAAGDRPYVQEAAEGSMRREGPPPMSAGPRGLPQVARQE
jgi:hypothetical protein